MGFEFTHSFDVFLCVWPSPSCPVVEPIYGAPDVPERKRFAPLFDEVVGHLVYVVWIIFPEQNFWMSFHKFLVYYCVMFDGAVFSFAEETPVMGFSVFAAVFFEVGEVGGKGGQC